MNAIRPTPDTADLLHFFWETFDTKAAPDADLEWISEASTAANSMAAQAADTLTGIGCLILSDLNSGKTTSGVLQGRDLPQMLWSAADTLKTIGALSFIGSEADFALRSRLSAQLAACKPGKETRATEGVSHV